MFLVALSEVLAGFLLLYEGYQALFFQAVNSALSISLGLLSFAIAYGSWRGMKWAWVIAIALSIVGIIIAPFAFPSSILGLAIDICVILYLLRPSVRHFFGLSSAQ